MINTPSEAVIVVAEQLYSFACDNWRWWRLRRRPKSPIEFVPAARYVVMRLISEEHVRGYKSK